MSDTNQMSDWKDALIKLAPTAASLFGTPFAGLAVSAVETALGLTASTKPSDSIAAIQKTISAGELTGDQIVALKNAETQLKQHLADNEIDLAKITASDVSNAREREMAVKDSTPKVLAYLLTLGFFGVLTFLLFGTPPAAAHDILVLMIGSLGTAWAGMIHYYYGSSPGSKLKDITIHSLSQ